MEKKRLYQVSEMYSSQTTMPGIVAHPVLALSTSVSTSVVLMWIAILLKDVKAIMMLLGAHEAAQSVGKYASSELDYCA